MKCSSCNHPIPEGKRKCIYCGAAQPHEQGIIRGMSGEIEEESGAAANGGRHSSEADHQNLSHSSWPQTGEGEGSGEIWSYSPIGNGHGHPTDPKKAEEFLFQQLQSLKSKRRVQLSKELQVAIFLISMLLAGLVVWFTK